MSKAKERVPVVILCGGMGTRLAEETETKPKPLVEVGGRPILWHIMKHYARHGFTDFILCLGYKGHMIRDYFLNYEYNLHDIRVQLGGGKGPSVEILGNGSGRDSDEWSVTLADTGAQAMTGARVKRIEKYVPGEHFLLTYGDGVSNVDIGKAYRYHLEHGLIGTVTGVRPPSRFGELVVEGKGDKNRVTKFAEKPDPEQLESAVSGFINGGFFVFSREFFKYLADEDQCVLEKKPLEKLTRDKKLMMYRHSGFWQCMDTMRDVTLLRELWASGSPPWKTWK